LGLTKKGTRTQVGDGDKTAFMQFSASSFYFLVSLMPAFNKQEDKRKLVIPVKDRPRIDNKQQLK